METPKLKFETVAEFKEYAKGFFNALQIVKKAAANLYAETQDKAISDAINTINDRIIFVALVQNNETVEITELLKQDEPKIEMVEI